MDIPIRYAGDDDRDRKGPDMQDGNITDEDIIYAPLDEEPPIDKGDVRPAAPWEQPPVAARPTSEQPASPFETQVHADVPANAETVDEIEQQGKAPDANEVIVEGDSTIADGPDASDELDAIEEEISDGVGDPIDDYVPAEEYDLLKSRYDRLMADWDNYRRRSSEELTQAKEAANKNLIEALIPTIDNFSLALAHVQGADIDPTVAGMLTGFEAIQRNLVSQLEREGLEVIAPEIGSPFDMMEHQAVERRECDLDTDTVAAVIQPGYKFKGSIIRPAMIAVAA